MNTYNNTRDPKLIILAIIFIVFAGCSIKAIAQEPPRPHLLVWAALKGHSMVPTFPKACLIELDLSIHYQELTPGMIVVFDSPDPRYPMKCHKLVTKRGGAWITKGDGNDHYDQEWVTEKMFRAVATGKYATVVVADLWDQETTK